MIDIKEKDDNLPPAADGVPVNGTVTPDTLLRAQERVTQWKEAIPEFLKQRLKTRKKSLGETVYNRSVYTGVGFGANEVGSMIFTGIFERGNNKIVGKEQFEQASRWMSKKFNMTHGGAKKLLMWASLNFIGCFVVPAVKIMDGHKGAAVKKLNHFFDRFKSGQSEADIAARDQDVAEAVGCEPAQSWGTLWIGRLIGMGTAIGLGYGVLREKGNEKLMGWFGDGATWMARKGGRGNPQSRLTKMADGYRPAAAPTAQSAFTYYSRLAGPETLGCATTSVVLEAASKYFARKWPRVKDPELCARVVAREEASKQEKPVQGAHTAKVAAESAQQNVQPGLG